jgi:AAA+ ATPase superfamily predicted ATPase
MNPFIISSYKDPEYFCDRERETAQLIDAIANDRNMVITSLRRMGKTGLIRHVFHKLNKSRDYYLFYIDIDHTDSLNDFVNKLANSLLRIPKKSFYERALDFLKQFRPVITFNPVTNQPEVDFRQEGARQDEVNIESLFTYIDKLNRKVIIAVDEFQRITSYENERVEAFLRSHIQHLNNVRFIFSGSSRHLLRSMFSDHSRPFYQSAGFMELGRLDKSTYTDFVEYHFRITGREINRNDIGSCIDWSDNHTFYMQYLFNMIWGSGIKNLSSDDIHDVMEELLQSRDPLYSNYRRLLTSNQFQLLRAIALEKEVEHPNSMGFIRGHNLGSISTVNSALKVLMDKELVYYEDGHYQLYDVFQSQWFRQKGR